MLLLTDTTILDLVRSIKPRLARFYLIFVTVISIKSTDTKRGFVGANVFYREHALAYPNNSFMTFGDPEAPTSTTVFMECAGNSSLEGQELYIVKTN